MQYLKSVRKINKQSIIAWGSSTHPQRHYSSQYVI